MLSLYNDIILAIENLYEAWGLDKKNIKDDLLKIFMNFEVDYLDEIKLHAIKIFTSGRYKYLESTTKSITDNYRHYLITYYPRMYKKCKYTNCFSKELFDLIYNRME